MPNKCPTILRMTQPHHIPPSHRKHSWATSELLDRLGLEGPAGAVPLGGEAPAKQGATWMLTGGTGWLGRHMAREILAQDEDAFLILPVRAADRDEAMGRVRRALCTTPQLRAKAEDERWNLRVQPMAISDLALEGAGGLADPCQQVDHVVHCAANMSLALSVDQAWRDNVVATQRTFDWARQHGATRFDHVSTLSVFVAGDTPMGGIRETDALDRAERLWGGYAASKWAAEAWLARQEGGEMALAVHRPGLLSYSHSDGWAHNDGLAAAARAFKLWGKPAWAWCTGREFVDWSPVDEAAQGMMRAMQAGICGPLHWASARPVPGRVLIEILERMGSEGVGDWPECDPLSKTARRALGRWHNKRRSDVLWWHDIFQSGLHRFHADRAGTIHRRWDWSPDQLSRALQRA